MMVDAENEEVGKEEEVRSSGESAAVRRGTAALAFIGVFVVVGVFVWMETTAPERATVDIATWCEPPSAALLALTSSLYPALALTAPSTPPPIPALAKCSSITLLVSILNARPSHAVVTWKNKDSLRDALTGTDHALDLLFPNSSDTMSSGRGRIQQKGIAVAFHHQAIAADDDLRLVGTNLFGDCTMNLGVVVPSCGTENPQPSRRYKPGWGGYVTLPSTRCSAPRESRRKKVAAEQDTQRQQEQQEESQLDNGSSLPLGTQLQLETGTFAPHFRFLLRYALLLDWAEKGSLTGADAPSLMKNADPLFTEDEVNALQLARIHYAALQTRATLGALAASLEQIPSLALLEHVAEAAKEACGGLSAARDLLAQGMAHEHHTQNHLSLRLTDEAALLAVRASELADAVYYDESVLDTAVFPEDQKYAIYVPLFFPLLFTILRALKTIRAKKKKFNLSNGSDDGNEAAAPPATQ